MVFIESGETTHCTDEHSTGPVPSKNEGLMDTHRVRASYCIAPSVCGVSLKRELARKLVKAARAADGGATLADAPVPTQRERRRPLCAPAQVTRVPEAKVRVKHVLREVSYVCGVAHRTRAAARAVRSAGATGPGAALGRRVVCLDMLGDSTLDVLRREKEDAGAVSVVEVA
jgi:hypothetical protein